jgi:transcriptional accessory protein Tex/SPT6
VPVPCCSAEHGRKIAQDLENKHVEVLWANEAIAAVWANSAAAQAEFPDYKPLVSWGHWDGRGQACTMV